MPVRSPKPATQEVVTQEVVTQEAVKMMAGEILCCLEMKALTAMAAGQKAPTALAVQRLTSWLRAMMLGAMMLLAAMILLTAPPLHRRRGQAAPRQNVQVESLRSHAVQVESFRRHAVQVESLRRHAANRKLQLQWLQFRQDRHRNKHKKQET